MKGIYLLFCISLIALCGCGQKTEDVEQLTVQQGAAVTAAEQWLEMIDAGDYARSWEESAAFFRSMVSKEKWEKTAAAVRKPLGEMTFRKVKSARYMTELPGAPDGEYVVVQFKTSFQNKKKAIETVTPMLETDGVWRVSGYYIK